MASGLTGVGRVVCGRYPGKSASDHETRGGRDHLRGTFVNRLDDLGVIDSAQVRRRDRQVGMPELALDDQQRDALTRHLDRVGMP
jgi:aryl-alcohol dehydrogenase-like predicted oxidoreductase